MLSRAGSCSTWAAACRLPRATPAWRISMKTSGGHPAEPGGAGGAVCRLHGGLCVQRPDHAGGGAPLA